MIDLVREIVVPVCDSDGHPVMSSDQCINNLRRSHWVDNTVVRRIASRGKNRIDLFKNVSGVERAENQVSGSRAGVTENGACSGVTEIQGGPS